jgi:hypothetical protein
MRFLRKCIVVSALSVGGLGLSANLATSDIIATLKNAPQAAVPAPPPQSQTRITLSVPFNELADLLSQFEFKIHGQGTVIVGYEGLITIDKVSVLHSADSHFPLRLNAPFHVVGKIGALSIDETGIATVNVDITIGNAWCPLVGFDNPSVTLDHSVPTPAGFGIGSISNYIATNILGHELRQQLTCATVKGFLAQAWRAVSVPITVAGNTLQLGVRPQEISLSDIDVKNDRVIFNAVITSAMTLKATPDNQQGLSIPLPNPKKIPLPATLRGHDYEGTISGSFSSDGQQ